MRSSSDNIKSADLSKFGLVEIGNKLVRIADLPKSVVRPQVNRRTIKRFIAAPVVSEANQGGKLQKKIARKKDQKCAIVEAFGLGLLNAGKPKRVTFVLITSQEQDDDNLRRTFKVYRDQIARSCGFDDRERVWKYLQRKKFRYESRGCWIVIQW